jgi:hypothetical protein
MVAILEAAVAGGKSHWVAHASGVLVSASRRNELLLARYPVMNKCFRKFAIAKTRSVRAGLASARATRSLPRNQRIGYS